MASIEEFYEELTLDTKATAQAEGIYQEDALFDSITDLLVDAGEFEEAERSFFLRQGSGIRVDGFCGDPMDSALASQAETGTLGLIILDYSQDEAIKTLTKTAMDTDFRRLEKFLRESLQESFRSSLEPSDPGFGLADLISARWSKVSKVNLFLITNMQLSSRVEGKTPTSLDGRDVIYNVWDLARIKKLIESGREREPLRIDFADLPTGPIPALLASAPSDKRRVYLAAMPGIDLAKIYDRWGTRLLEANVRVFLQARSNVNKGIKRTLENEPELFFSFNNGITATAERVETSHAEDEGLVITALDNLQIVNGGQTTASVYAAYKKKNDLSKVYVQMKLSEVSAVDAKDLVPRISQYANSQNKVSAADFFSNHPYQVRIEEFSKRILAPARDESFTRTKWYYERARGSYRDAQAYLTPADKKKFVAEYPKSQTFTKTDLAKYLMVWTDEGYYVNRGAQKNFAKFATEVADAWEKDNSQFNEYYFQCLIAKKIIFDETRKIVMNRDWYEAGGYLSQHTVLAIGALSSAVRRMKKRMNFLAVWNTQGLPEPLRRALEQAADAAHTVLMHPASGYRNISEWAKQKACWDKLETLKVDWDQAWVDSLISIEDEADTQREESKVQKELNGIEAQTLVLQQGAEFWRKVLAWCKKEGECTPKELGILEVATQMPRRMPSDKQSVILVNLMDRLKSGGCPYHLRKGSSRPTRAARRGRR